MLNLFTAIFAILTFALPTYAIATSAADSGDCPSILASAPYPRHLHDFDKLVFQGHTIKKGELLSYTGKRQVRNLQSNRYENMQGKTARVIAIDHERGKITLMFENALIDTFDVREIIESPEVQKTYDEDLKHIPLPKYSDTDYIWLDEIPDPETSGFINRARYAKRVAEHEQADYSSGFVIYKFAKHFKIARQLGFALDEKNRIIFYPDEKSFNIRLKRLFAEWRVQDSLSSKEANGKIEMLDWVRMIARDSQIGRSSKSDYNTHWHDLDVHTLAWIAGIEAVQILRERLIFLDSVTRAIESQPYPDTELLAIVHDYMTRTEGYNNMEVGLPDGHDIVGLLDEDKTRLALYIMRIREAILSVGRISAADLKAEILREKMDAHLRQIIEEIPASTKKINRSNIKSVMKRVMARFK